MIICHWAYCITVCHSKQLQEGLMGVFWWFPALSEDQEKICRIHQNYLVAYKDNFWNFQIQLKIQVYNFFLYYDWNTSVFMLILSIKGQLRTCSSAATINMAITGSTAPFIVMETDILSNGMASNNTWYKKQKNFHLLQEGTVITSSIILLIHCRKIQH